MPAQHALDALVDMQTLIGDWEGEAFMAMEAADLLRDCADQFLYCFPQLGRLADNESLLFFGGAEIALRMASCSESRVSQRSSRSDVDRRGLRGAHEDT